MIVTVVLTALILGAMLWVLSRAHSPNYRPSRAQVADLLKQVIEGDASQQAWDLFVGFPDVHDPELETIRQRCIALSEGNEDRPAYPSGIGRFIFNKAGRSEVGVILQELQAVIDGEPFNQDF